jgi:hypothetical protein
VYGVTQNGEVSYAIPINVTEGIGDLTPRLAISHVGPGQRTILGVGFQLAGFSYITPCRKTIAQDLNAAPVTLTSADRYCLDGARLRGVTGTYAPRARPIVPNSTRWRASRHSTRPTAYRAGSRSKLAMG